MSDLELLPDLADAADAYLAESGIEVDRDPRNVFADEAVFIFWRVPAPIDDQVLVVHRVTREVQLVAAPPWESDPFPAAVPLA